MTCPKCKGYAAQESDQYGEFVRCLICGLRVDKPVVASKPDKVEMISGSHHYPVDKSPSPETIRWRKLYEADPEGYRRRRRERYAAKKGLANGGSPAMPGL